MSRLIGLNISAVREEASIFQMLDHGNIVEMYGVIVGDEPALVLELCRGQLSVLRFYTFIFAIFVNCVILSNQGIFCHYFRSNMCSFRFIGKNMF